MKQTEWRTFSECPLCGTSSFRCKFPLKKLKVAQCRSCALLFLNPYPSSDLMQEFYATEKSMEESNRRLRTYYEGLEGSQTEGFYRSCLKQFRRYVPKEGTLLDVGCGRGHFLSLAREQQWAVAGIEPAKEHADYARQKLGLDVRALPLEKADFPPESFDVITLWDVIEHVDNPNEIISRVSQWCKPSGCLLIATPNHDSLLNWIAEAFWVGSARWIQRPLEYFFVPEHILYFTSRTLKRLLEKTGWRTAVEIRTGTDIERYDVGRWVKVTAKVLLFLSRLLRAENRIVAICQKRSVEELSGRS